MVRAKLKDTDDPPVSASKIVLPWSPILEGSVAPTAANAADLCPVKIEYFPHTIIKAFTLLNTQTAVQFELSTCWSVSVAPQYVGQTSCTLSQRMAGHRAASKRKSNLTIVQTLHRRRPRL